MTTLADIKDRKPNQELITLLETYLAEAKSGELRTIISVTGYDDDRWSNSWRIDVRNGTRKMLGEMAMLQYDMLTNIALKDGDTFISRIANK